MKIRFNPLLLGLFVVGGVAIAIAALLGLGSSLFHPAGHFVFYLPNSAGGLDQGSGVRLDGVRVGQIERVNIYYNPETQKSFVGVTCVINRNLLIDPQGNQLDITNPQKLKELVGKGLVVQVQTAGLVGTEYVELGFKGSEKPIVLTGLPSSPYPVVPAVPAKMAQLTDNISGIVSNLHQIDFGRLGQQINAVLVAANGQIAELQTNRLTDHISTAALSVGDFMNSADLRAAVARLDASASTLQSLLTNLNAQVAPTGTNLNATLVSARQSVEALQDFVKLRNQLGEQTYELMNQLNETARSVEQLSDFLQQHPNSIITGRTQDHAP
ncbi:MAG TPA: MlaD family protein [Alphaproteobacteria bacterium]|nr:MlaD family protein [Alphaproteobacteria bacterium]